MTYDDYDEVVARANDTDFGLAAVVWTKDLVLAHTLADRIHAGTVFVNQLPMIDPGAPWGSFGLSGYGREMGSTAWTSSPKPKACLSTSIPEPRPGGLTGLIDPGGTRGVPAAHAPAAGLPPSVLWTRTAHVAG